MRIIKICFCALIISVMLVTVSASSNFGNGMYEYEVPEVTIIFDDATAFSEQKMQEIANSIVGLPTLEEIVESPNNLICAIVGHNLSTTSVAEIRHKVTIWNPRCLMSIYDVTACSRCDYVDIVLVSSFHITCCPENLPLPEGTNPTE